MISNKIYALLYLQGLAGFAEPIFMLISCPVFGIIDVTTQKSVVFHSLFHIMLITLWVSCGKVVDFPQNVLND